jgi:hypothetical protein
MEGRTKMNTQSWRVRSLVGASALAVTAAVGLGTGGFGGIVFAAAKQAPQSTTMTGSHSVNTPVSTPTKETLVATYVEEGDSDTTIPSATLTPIDAVNKIKCPAASGQTCTIVDTASIQEASSTGDADNYIADAAEIDGTQFDDIGGGFYTAAPADGSYGGGTWTETNPEVSAGAHKLQTFAYSEFGATLGVWTITYQVYEP